MRLSYFRFELRPYDRALVDGSYARTLEVKVIVDGEEYYGTQYVPDTRPFETEIEYYLRKAAYELQTKLREVETNQSTTSEQRIDKGKNNVTES